MHNQNQSPDGDSAMRLQRTAFPRMYALLEDGHLTSDIRQMFLDFAESTDLSWMASKLSALSTHDVALPETGQKKPVHGVLLAEKSLFFDELIKYSSGRELQLPYEKFGFLRSSIAKVLDFINAADSQPVSVFADDNLLDLYMAADYLLIPELRNKLLSHIKIRCAANLGLAIDIWAFSQHCYLPELNSLTFDQILYSFPAVINQPHWLELDFDMVKTVLSHDGLNVVSELVVLEAASRWLGANWTEREVSGEALLACLRRGLIKPAELPVLLLNQTLASYPNLLALYREFPMVPPASVPLYRLHADLLAVAAMPRQPHEAVFLLGGWCQEDRLDQAGPRAACQVFNARANSWTMWTPSPDRSSHCIGQVQRRVYAGCVVVGDVLHVIGGFDGERAINTVSCYNLRRPAERGGWYEGSCMVCKRYYVCCAALAGQIYAIGGHSGETQDRHGGRLDSVERMDVSENCWMPAASMRTVRSDAGAAALAGRVYVAGGFNGQQYHDTAEAYDPTTDQWTFISRMNFPRGGVSLVAMGNALYAVGGNDGQSRLAVVEAYQHEYDGWEFAGRLSRQKSNLSTAVLEGGIMVMGGWSDQPTVGILSSVEKFTPSSDATVQVADMTYAASATAACAVVGRDLIAPYLPVLPAKNPWRLDDGEQQLLRLHQSNLAAAAAAAAAPQASQASLREPSNEEQMSTDSQFIQSSQDAEPTE